MQPRPTSFVYESSIMDETAIVGESYRMVVSIQYLQLLRNFGNPLHLNLQEHAPVQPRAGRSNAPFLNAGNVIVKDFAPFVSQIFVRYQKRKGRVKSRQSRIESSHGGRKWPATMKREISRQFPITL